MDRKKTKIILGAIALLAVFIFSVLMLNTIRQYFSFRTDVGFLRFKQSVVQNPYWMFFFYVHIFSVILCLLAGLSQFSAQVLKEQPRLHRLLGKLYVYNILLINFPACMVLAVFSNGGMLGISGFVIQDLLWAYVTIAAVVSIKRKHIEKHNNLMILSYAITTTAITFRIFKNVFYDLSGMPYQLFYGLNVWAALALNLLIAAWIIRKRSASTIAQRSPY